MDITVLITLSKSDTHEAGSLKLNEFFFPPSNFSAESSWILRFFLMARETRFGVRTARTVNSYGKISSLGESVDLLRRIKKNPLTISKLSHPWMYK